MSQLCGAGPTHDTQDLCLGRGLRGCPVQPPSKGENLPPTLPDRRGVVLPLENSCKGQAFSQSSSTIPYMRFLGPLAGTTHNKAFSSFLCSPVANTSSSNSGSSILVWRPLWWLSLSAPLLHYIEVIIHVSAYPFVVQKKALCLRRHCVLLPVCSQYLA